MMRRYPRIFSEPAALPLFCLAPHGVFPASRIAPRAVSSYLAFSPLPVPLLPKNRRCLFCDTFRRHDFTIAAPAFFTRHVAVWCSDFPPASVAAYQRSSAIDEQFSTTEKEENRTADYADDRGSLTVRDVSTSLDMTKAKMAAARSGRKS
jgi:hypothetical protein